MTDIQTMLPPPAPPPPPPTRRRAATWFCVALASLALGVAGAALLVSRSSNAPTGVAAPAVTARPSTDATKIAAYRAQIMVGWVAFDDATRSNVCLLWGVDPEAAQAAFAGGADNTDGIDQALAWEAMKSILVAECP